MDPMLQQRKVVGYAYRPPLTGAYSTMKTCDWLRENHGGNYKWLRCGASESKKRAPRLEKVIATTFTRFKHRHETHGIAVELNEARTLCSAKMKAECTRKIRIGKGCTFFSNIRTRIHVSDNILRRYFTAHRRYESWIRILLIIRRERPVVIWPSWWTCIIAW